MWQYIGTVYYNYSNSQFGIFLCECLNICIETDLFTAAFVHMKRISKVRHKPVPELHFPVRGDTEDLSDP